jgi:hypothetical protein
MRFGFMLLGLTIAACNGSTPPEGTLAEQRPPPRAASESRVAANAAPPKVCVSDRSQLLELLGRRHDAPSWKQIEAVCQDAPRALSELASDAQVDNLRRMRAIVLLGQDNSAPSAELLAKLGTSDLDAAIRRNAIASLAQRRDAVDTAVPAAERALSDGDPHVRAAAADALGALGRGRGALERARAGETVTFVKARLDQALSSQ